MWQQAFTSIVFSNNIFLNYCLSQIWGVYKVTGICKYFVPYKEKCSSAIQKYNFIQQNMELWCAQCVCVCVCVCERERGGERWSRQNVINCSRNDNFIRRILSLMILWSISEHWKMSSNVNILFPSLPIQMILVFKELTFP